MLFAMALVVNILITVLELMGYAASVYYPIDIGKFSYNKQRLVLGIINCLFTISIVVVYLLKQSETVICALVIAQLLIGFIYVAVLSVFCKKRYFSKIAEEIDRLNLDINEDIIVLRRQLMERSDISCSTKVLSQVIETICRKK